MKIGDKIGFWELIGERRDTQHRKQFLARCVCGQEKAIDAYNLARGTTKSCGCQRQNRLRHGYTRKGKVRPEWQAWNHMKQRCYNPKDKHYDDYGGRGIVVCNRWVNSFDAFLKDMGERPSAKHSLDRIDGNKGYSPSNCRWGTRKQQGENRRTVITLEFDGKKLCVADWSKLTGIKRGTILARYHKGWTIDRILAPVA